jgi:DNA-binding transcriptional LysR family regulator
MMGEIYKDDGGPMNNHDLHVFATAARLGSVTRAAKSLSTVQSNVTARIRGLEDELGVQLFHRHHRGISLTPKGQELLPYAEQMMVLVQKARATVTGSREAEGVLRIGSLQSTASVHLPGILKAYIGRHRRVDLAIETGTAAELTQRVLDRKLDGAFVAGPVQHPELNGLTAFVEELVLVTPAGYRTVEAYLEDGAIPKVLVFKAGCYYRRLLERYLAGAGLEVLQEMEFGTLEGIIGCVSAGLGMTMMPRSVVERSAFRKRVRAHALEGDSGRVETLFVTHKEPARSSALERFMDVIVAGRTPRGETGQAGKA